MYGVIVRSGKSPTTSLPSHITPIVKPNTRDSTTTPELGSQYPSSPDRNATAETTVSSPASAHEIVLRIISPHPAALVATFSTNSDPISDNKADGSSAASLF